MRRFVALAAFGVLVLSLGALQPVGRAQSPQQPPPRFTAGVDVVEIDVSVLDKDHKPVRGLKLDDFTVREDGKPQKLVALSEVYSEPPKPPSAPWMWEVPADVETNTPAEHNLFVVIIDDALLTYVDPKKLPKMDPYKLRNTIAIARRAVEGLNDDELASVIFTWDNWKGVNFTNDRRKLLKAVDSTAFGPDPGCMQFLGSAQTLLSSVEALSTVQHRRKTVVFASLGFGINFTGPVPGDCNPQVQGYLYQAMVLAQRSNVNIYTFDPSGLRGMITNFDRRQLDFLQAAAENTGGRAIINTNEPASHVDEILQEARAYYLVGYELSDRAADGRFHRIEVTVNRPGVEVRTRKVRIDPLPEKDATKAPPPLAASVGGFLPNGEMRLGLTTAAFMNLDGTARVVIGLTGQLPDPVPGRTRDDIGLTVRVFTTDGRAVTSADEMIPVLFEPFPGAPDTAAFRGPGFALSSSVVLKPGPYALRIGAHSRESNKTGSVYSDITVPDFAKEPLSLSGVIMTESVGSSLRGGDTLNALEPTAARVFDTDGRIQAFLRVYQEDPQRRRQCRLKVRITDEHNTPVVNRLETLPATAFARGRQADYFLRLPLSTLKAGEYWLSLEAAMGKRTAKRDVRFTVK